MGGARAGKQHLRGQVGAQGGQRGGGEEGGAHPRWGGASVPDTSSHMSTHVHPLSPVLQWLRPKVLYNYGPNITGKDGTRLFDFREHTLLENPR